MSVTGASVVLTDVVDQIIDDWTRERPDIDSSSIGVFGRMRRLLTLERQVTAALHERHGVNPASFDVLASLRRVGAPFRRTVSELAATSFLTSSAITLRLDRLERAGLVRRMRSDDDRRLVHAELTGKGLALIDEIFAEHIAMENRLLGLLDERQRSELADLLRALGHSVRAAAE